MNTIALVLIFKTFYFLDYNFQFIQEDERAKSSKKVKKADDLKRKRVLEDEEDDDYVYSENEEENEDSEAEAEVTKIRGKVNKKVKEAQKHDKKIAKQAEDAAKSAKNYYDSFKNDKIIKTQLAYKEVT